MTSCLFFYCYYFPLGTKTFMAHLIHKLSSLWNSLKYIVKTLPKTIPSAFTAVFHCLPHTTTTTTTHKDDKMPACSQKNSIPCNFVQMFSSLQDPYRGVTVPSFHSIRISARCKVGVEWGNCMACWVSGTLSPGTGDPGTLISGLGVYDFKTQTTFFLLVKIKCTRKANKIKRQ